MDHLLLLNGGKDEILQNEFDAVTYRVLAYLLLGLVRIYSKKVEFLFDECNDVLIKINDFLVGEKGKSWKGNSRLPLYAITVPDRFELDAFDLEIIEDVGRENVMALEEITLKDGASKAVEMQKYSLGKYPFEDLLACHDTFSTDHLPAEDNLKGSMGKLQGNIFRLEERVNLDTFSVTEGDASNPIIPFGEQALEITQSENEVQGDLGSEMLLDERFHEVGEEPLDLINLYGEDRQSDGVLTDLPGLPQLEKETCLASNEDNNLCNLQASTEKLLDQALCVEVSVDVEMFSRSKEPLELIKSSAEDHPLDGELTSLPGSAQLAKESSLVVSEDSNLSNLQASTEKLLDQRSCQEVSVDIEMFSRSKEPLELIKSSGEVHHSNAELMKSKEMSLPGNDKCQLIKRKDPLSITVDATQSKFLNAPGVSTPGPMVVHTPATKERAQISKRRKCCFDDVTVFPNHLIRQHIEDASDLVSKRRKVHTGLTAWKALRISDLSRGFSIPLLPCISSELKSLFCQERLKVAGIAETVEALEPECPAVGISMERLALAPETPEAKSLKQMVVAPETPAARSIEKMVVAPETAMSRSLEQIAPETTTARSLEQIAPETPTARSLEQIAPGTPTARSLKQIVVDPETPSRSEQMPVASEIPILQLVASTPSDTPGSLKDSRSDTVKPAQSFQITEEPSSSKDQGFNPILMIEEANFFDDDDHELHEFSARTRMVAGYLHRSFLYHKNRSEDEAVNFFHLSEGKTKKESARLFYEILVLKSKGFVDVRQDEAYGDILVQKVPQWDQSYEAVCL
ncbi:sister chromatid cohesion 1 protein 2 isoform X3 [Mangifera indica]|uniref:sister chromatid cohesion 1 protein 2 isoform X3 n=1 Tax=Mangifera indica TaxID=29780 RepID=UPI001CFA4E1D|nr:sister chromatid cohesion 1 protein 2 isoform X3 [Mangifera indica]